MGSSRLKVAFITKPVELLASVAMLMFGILVSIFSEDEAWSAAGAGLSALGGVLFSWSMASINSRQQAADVLRPELETLSKHLGTVSGQIARSIQAVRVGIHEPETGFANILQSNGTIYNLVTDLQRIAGTEFDSQDLVDTVERLEELGERLYGHPANHQESVADDETAHLKNEFELLKKHLQNQVAQMGGIVAPSTNLPVKVKCPDCQEAVHAKIRPVAGASAMATCENCGIRFHIHRDGSGEIFSNAEGAWSKSDTSLEYARILHTQGIRFPKNLTLRRSFDSVEEVFTKSENGRFESWDKLDSALHQSLCADGLEIDLADVKRVRQLGYKSKLYEFHENNGISLRKISEGLSVYEHVCIGLASRIHQNVDGEIDFVQLSILLTGQSTDMEFTKNIVSKLSKFQN